MNHGSSVSIVTVVREEHSSFAADVRDFFVGPDRLRPPRSHLFKGYRVMYRVGKCDRGVTLTPNLNLVLVLRMRKAILLHLHAPPWHVI